MTQKSLIIHSNVQGNMKTANEKKWELKCSPKGTQMALTMRLTLGL